MIEPSGPAAVTVLTSADVQALDWMPLHGDERISNKILWRSESGGTIVGLVRLPPGTEDAGHVHPAATQHTWVLEGQATIVGHEVGPCSYAFVPPGVDHHTATVGAQPCTMFYVYQPYLPTHGEHDHE
jgi:quercetin dioxygenase-like cupin family protein